MKSPQFDSREFQLGINRRTFLGRAAYGLGGIALASLLDPRLIGSANAAPVQHGWKGIIDPPHFPVRAKRIIHLCMAGGPSQFESLDWKPELKRLDEQPSPSRSPGASSSRSCRGPCSRPAGRRSSSTSMA